MEGPFCTQEELKRAQDELNARFAEHSVGYRVQSFKIIRIDSERDYEEVIEPALRMISQPEYKGAEQEYLKAQRHHREGDYENAILWAAKAVESTMRVICGERECGVGESPSARNLIDALVEEGLFARHMQSVLIGLFTIRNKHAGHGQGAQPRTVPACLASYALKVAAANIVLLIDTHRQDTTRE